MDRPSGITRLSSHDCVTTYHIIKRTGTIMSNHWLMCTVRKSTGPSVPVSSASSCHDNHHRYHLWYPGQFSPLTPITIFRSAHCDFVYCLVWRLLRETCTNQCSRNSVVTKKGFEKNVRTVPIIEVGQFVYVNDSPHAVLGSETDKVETTSYNSLMSQV